MRHQRVVQAREDAGHGRQLAADLADMARIVEADAEDLVGIGDHRLQLDVVERQVGRGALECRCQLAQRLARDCHAQAGPARRCPRRQIDNTALDDRANLGCARMAKTDQPHGTTLDPRACRVKRNRRDGRVMKDPSLRSGPFIRATQ